MIRELLRYRDLIRELVIRDLKVRYRRSTIGFVWTMLQPLMTMLVMQVAFSTVFKFQLANFPVYVLAGVLFWNFFSQTITTSMNSLKGNAGLLKKLPLPREVFPLASVISGVVNMLLALVPLLAILIVTGHRLSLALLFLPVSIVIASMFALGAGFLLSPLAVFFHDTVEFVTVILGLLFYLTPIMYPLSILPPKVLWLVRFNPLRSILEVFRDPIYFGKIPPLSHLSVAFGIAVGILLLGAWVFRRSSEKIPYYV